MKIPILILFLLQSIWSLAQTLIIEIPESYYNIDETNNLIVSRIENIATYTELSEYDEIVISFNGEEYFFDTKPDSLSYTKAYSVSRFFNSYTLYFSPLPIISVETTTTILDEPKVLAHLTYVDEEQVLFSPIGIEIRGGFSQEFPKKTFDIEFWEDENGEENKDVQFRDLRVDDDWILDALYNEPLRLRSYMANKLWLEMHQPYYTAEESKAKSGADVEYIELFLDGTYNGLYNLSEQVDKKHLKLKEFDEAIKGELYKAVSWGVPTFGNLPNFDNNSREWDGYEMKYPKEEHTTDWQYVYDFTDFVINASDTDFVNDIWTQFNDENYLDYFIFLNILRATDNTGKNIYLAKYNSNEPYFYVPWDLDACFGTMWLGENDAETDDILYNNFQARVMELNPNNYSVRIAEKWFDYRNNILATDKLINSFDNQYRFFLDNKIYEREAIVYPNYLFGEEDFSYLITWLEDRLSFLDVYFEEISSTDSPKPNALVYPNPSTNTICIGSSSNLLDKEYHIFDILGQLVDRGNINMENSISLERLNSGNYILFLENNAYRIIKQ